MGHDMIPGAPPSRMNLPAAAPEVFGAMVNLSVQAENKLPADLASLVKIRASQINGCPYCLAMHTSEAREAGVSEQRLGSLSGWRDAPLYSDSERAALALTEAMTVLADEQVPKRSSLKWPGTSTSQCSSGDKSGDTVKIK